MPIASVARSGRPIFETTCEISANRLRRICSTRVETCTDSASEIEGSLRVSIRMEPSSSRGMNSVPRNGTDPIASVTTISATATVRSGCRICRARWWAYRSRRRTNQASSS